MLDELDWTETCRREAAASVARGFPHSVVAGLEEEHLGVATALAPQAQPRGQHARVVHDHERLAELSGQVAERRRLIAPVPRSKTSSFDSSRRSSGCCAISSGGRS